MNKYFYFKEVQKTVASARVIKRKPQKPLRLNTIFFLISLSIGSLIILTQFIFPSIYFSSREIIGASSESTVNYQNAETGSNSDYDLSDLVKSDTRREINTKNNPEMFLLSVPEIGLENIKVYSEVDGSKKEIYGPILEKGVAHYLGTPFPGGKGNSIIFGHSSFTWAFNPANYLTIFTRLPELKPGSEIYIKINDKDLKYEVTKIKTIKPEGLTDALKGEDDRPTIILMTCVPPGMTTYRLLVFAE